MGNVNSVRLFRRAAAVKRAAPELSPVQVNSTGVALAERSAQAAAGDAARADSDAPPAALLDGALQQQLDDAAAVISDSGSLAPVLLSAATLGKHELLAALLNRIPSSLLSQAPVLAASLSAALSAAAENGRSRCLSLLLNAASAAPSPRVLEAAGADGVTALMNAAAQGQLACLHLLLQHSPDTQVQATDCNGWNALMHAACSGHAACLDPLLAHNPAAQVAALCSNGRNALGYAVAARFAACLPPLLAHDPAAQLALPRHSPLAAAAVAGDVACLQLLLPHARADEPRHRLGQALQLICGADGGLPKHLEQRECAEMLIASGAKLPGSAEQDSLQPMATDLEAGALMSGMDAEAAGALAEAAAPDRKRPAGGDADDDGAPKCARTASD